VTQIPPNKIIKRTTRKPLRIFNERKRGKDPVRRIAVKAME